MVGAIEPPLRIAIFGESYLPYLSGVTISTESLALGLTDAGHDVLLVMPRPVGGATAQRPGRSGREPEVVWLPSYQGPPPAPDGYRMPIPMPSAALRAVRAFRPHIVHAQSPFVSGLMARRVARAARAPLVFTHHTRFGDYRHYLGPLASPGAALMTAYIRSFWRGCGAIVAPSRDLASEIEAGLGRRGSADTLSHQRRRPIVRAIPTGLDLVAIRAVTPVDPRPLAGWPAESIVLVSVGRLAREKSVDLLVTAFADAAGEEPRLRLLLIGDGPLRPELERLARSSEMTGRLHLTGGLPHLDALAMAAGADMFGFASRTETQGLVLAEALACGLPVVTLEGPGLLDTVRESIDAIVVGREPLDTAAERLGDAIATLAKHTSRRAQMVSAARAGADRFELGHRIREMVGLYNETLASR